MCKRSNTPITSRKQIVDRFENINYNFQSIDKNLADVAAAYVDTEPERYAIVMDARVAVDEMCKAFSELKSTL